MVTRWRDREEELSVSIAQAEAVGLATHVLELDQKLEDNGKQLDQLVRVSEAAPLLQEKGFRAISVAKCLTAWSYHGRVRSEAAFGF